MGRLSVLKKQTKTDRIRKEIISIFKNINFEIVIITNVTDVDFLDVKSNLENNRYRPYKKPKVKLTYIDLSSNHPPNIKKHLKK